MFIFESIRFYLLVILLIAIEFSLHYIDSPVFIMDVLLSGFSLYIGYLFVKGIAKPSFSFSIQKCINIHKHLSFLVYIPFAIFMFFISFWGITIGIAQPLDILIGETKGGVIHGYSLALACLWMGFFSLLFLCCALINIYLRLVRFFKSY